MSEFTGTFCGGVVWIARRLEVLTGQGVDEMKLLLAIHEFFPESTGGAEVLARDTAKMLQHRGHDVRVFTAYPAKTQVKDEERFDTYSYNGLTVERFFHSPVAMGTQSNIFELEYNNLFFAGYFRDFLERWKPDVVHFFHLHRLTGSAISVCAELGIPAVYTATDFWTICPLSQLRLEDNSMCTGPDRNAVKCLRHLVMAFQPEEIRSKMRMMPDWVLGLTVRSIKAGLASKSWFSPYVKALAARPEFMKGHVNMLKRVLVPTRLMGSFLQRHVVDKSRIRFQQYGINMTPFESQPKNDRKWRGETLRVGFIGALFEHKGAHILLQAIRSLPRSISVAVSVHGNLNQSPEYGETLKAIAGEDNRISFCGSFPNDQIGRILAELDILVVPSLWYENSPLVIYEAQAAGCPVIATDLGGMSEVVVDGVNGLLFQRGDIAGLARAIALVARDRELLATLARNARQPKSMSEYVTELETCYEEVITENGDA
jgi:glycosyltransferase involved in cell wall biosynthesis